MYDVIVIGCGAAGVAALSRLHTAGLKVLGLEASSRLGGRVKTTNFANGKIEEGAEWVHGEEDNVTFGLSNKYNILEPTDFGFEFFLSNGQKLDTKLGNDLFHLCMGITSTVDEYVTPELQSMADHFAQRYPEELELQGFNLPKELQKDFMNWYHRQENVIDGSDDWSRTSVKGLAQYKVCDGNPLISWGHNGYCTIIDILLKGYPDLQQSLDIEILKNHIVSKILWKQKDQGVTVICENGSIFDCKAALVTVSLGVLKEKYELLFEPQLPVAKINCIKGIEFGTVNKVFLKYDNRWWGDTSWIGLVWSEDDVAEITEGDEWTSGIFCLSTPNAQPNVLCVWLSGVAARHMESLSLGIVKKKVEIVLNKFMGQYFPVPHALLTYRSSWYSNPFTRGSYSYHGMECDKYNATNNGLKSPVLNENGAPVILFAGEATSEHYFSTVHGAIESGYREADRFIDYITSGSKVAANP